MSSRLVSAVFNAGVSDYIRALPYIGASLILIVAIEYFRNPLRNVPGPFWAKFSNAWLVWHTQQGSMHRVVMDAHKKYGPLVRLGPYEISTGDIDSLKVIYGAGNNFDKSEWYLPWQGKRKWDLFGERNEGIHRAQRRLVNHIYSLTNVRKLEAPVDSAISYLLSKLAAFDGKPIDVGKWMRLFAYDVIGEVTFSKNFGFMESGKDDGAFTMIDDCSKCAMWVGYLPWFYRLSVALAPYTGLHLAITQRQGKLLQMSQDAINEGLASNNPRNDMLKQLKEVQKARPDVMDDVCVASMAASNIFAGSDSTSVSISAFLYHLMKTPDAKQKLINEVNEHAAKHNIKHGTVFDLEIINNMPYLNACMFEALRCHPAVGINLNRVVPPEGMSIAGQFIPGGSGISANAWVIHLNKEVFGEDAAKFNPDRWLQAPERVAIMKRNFFSFGQGSRYCIGRNLGWLEMSKIMPTMLHDYEVDFVDPTKDAKQVAAVFIRFEDLLMNMKPRADAVQALEALKAQEPQELKTHAPES